MMQLMFQIAMLKAENDKLREAYRNEPSSHAER